MRLVRTFISWALLLLVNSSYSQTVDFSFSTSSGLFCNPQQVDFVQNCSGSPTNFIWRFGNGQQSASPNASATYTNPGTYTVTLTAVYIDNAVSTTKTVVINPTPTIALAADRNYICQPGTINFTATGSAFITSYEWDFGDGSPLQTTPGNTVAHAFATYNSFTVTVRGITAAGCSATSAISVQVTKFPITNASVTPDKGCIPITPTLTASVSLPAGDAPANFAWDFGDGSGISNTTGGSTTHTYNTTSQINTASVLITTAQGCTNQYNFPAFAFGTPPYNTTIATADGRNTYCGSETINFVGNAVNANSYLWDFGDGVTQTTTINTVNHRYSTLGTMNVSVTPIFNGCNGTVANLSITIVGVVANYSFANTCGSKNTFSYANASLGNVSSFRWTFSDIPATPDAVNYNTTHTFPASGSFNTKLYVYDAVTGCSDSLVTNQYTAVPIFTSNKAKVCKDSVITYTVSNSYDPASNYTYEYHIDGAIVPGNTLTSFSYTPLVHGIFNEYVVISGPNTATCDDTIYLSNSTTVQGPVLSFTVSPLRQCFLNNSFPLNNTTAPFFPGDNINNWQWSFGDNSVSAQQFPPAHTYPAAGSYKIILTATDINGCGQKDSVTVTIEPTPDIAVFPKIDTLCAGQSLNLYAFTADTLTWLTTTNLVCQSPLCDTVLVTPTVTTNYIAQAKNRYGCLNRDTSLIKVYGPFTLQVFPADTTVCPNQPIHYATNTAGVTTWSPSTFLNATTIPDPVSIPDQPTIYTITVNDSVGCYGDTTTVSVGIYPTPTVNAGPDIMIPYNNPFTFSPAYGPGVAGYLWSPNVNHLSCINCPVISGIAEISAAYTIEVTSTDGCKAKDTVKLVVACEKANLLIPTAFTPNNNGRNDVFYPVARGYRIINKMIVFDRWGNKVFERYNFQPNAPNLGWDGRSLNRQQSDTNVFVWVVQATCDAGGVVETKGTVVLIR